MSAPPPARRCPELGDQGAMLERLVTGSPVVFYVCEETPDGFVPIYASPNAERVMGWPAAAFTDEPGFFPTHLHPDDLARCLQIAVGLRDGEHATVEYRFAQPDGSYRWIRDSTEAVHHDGGRTRCLLGRAIDVTLERNAESSLALSEVRYRQIVEATHDGIAVLDASDRVTYANARMETLLGVTPGGLVGALPESVVTEHARPDAMASLARVRQGTEQFVETSLLRSDGATVALEVSAVPLRDADGGYAGVLAIMHDITAAKATQAELARTQDRLRESEKLEALGRLAAGVAHDFNNVLSVVSICCGLAKEEMKAGNPRRDDLSAVQTAVESGTALVQKLLDFARARPRAPRRIDLGAHVLALKPLLAPLVGRRIALDVVVPTDPLYVEMDPAEVGQIVMNLSTNARDAMQDGGRLQVWVELDASLGRRRAVLRVTDQGGGMDAATRARVFEPFFTTKGERGTGLGLATVHAIVVAAGGTIRVESEPGTGTTFVVRLPVVE